MELTKKDLDRFGKEYSGALTQHVASRAVTKNGIMASATNNDVIAREQFDFSVDVDSEAVANQKQSGRCWMFATLNIIRFQIEKDLDLPAGTFELSQDYLAFYNKLERCNWLLDQMAKTAASGLDDRRVCWLFDSAMQDGGDFPMMIDLVDKYGVVPHNAMPETACSNNTAELNDVLGKLLKQYGLEVRDLVNQGKDQEAVDARIREMLSDCYRVLAVCYGEPPQTFDFEYTDTKGQYHGDFGLTPATFTEKYVKTDLDDYVGVTNVPTDQTPFNATFGIEGSNEIVAGSPNLYLNVSIDDLKDLTVKQLKAGLPCWFGCDVLQSSDVRSRGIMSLDLYDVEDLFGIRFTGDKTSRYVTRESLPTHAMVIAGVDLHDDKPVRWKVENSWGVTAPDKSPLGHKGYMTMDTPWFDQYVYEVAIRKDFLTDEQKAALETEPHILPFWNTFNPVEA